MVKVLLLVVPPALVAVTVYETAAVAVADEPLITPAGLIVTPTGNAGLMVHEVAVPPVFPGVSVKAVLVV